MEIPESKLHKLGKLRLSKLPSPFEEKVAGRPAVRWTRYGRWTDSGKQVLNELGNVIYEEGPMYRRKR